MTKSDNEFQILRYIRFLDSCKVLNALRESKHTENHHILPRAKDMFPEFVKAPWNIIKLTPRQHFIAHWMTFKIFRNKSQAFALRCFAKGRSNKYQSRERSKDHDLLMEITRAKVGEFSRGKATYITPTGEKITCRTDDPLVLDGTYVSTTKGRSYKGRSKEWREQQSIKVKLRRKNENPKRSRKLYFLDLRIEISFYTDVYIDYLDQGWSQSETPEYRKRKAIESNQNRSPESRKKAGIKISETINRKRLIKKQEYTEKFKNEMDKILEILNQGKGVSGIAAHFGINNTLTKEILTELGVRIPTASENLKAIRRIKKWRWKNTTS